MSDRKDEPQTLHEAWSRVVEASGFWRIIIYLMDRATDALAWITARIEDDSVWYRLPGVLNRFAWVCVVVSFVLLAYVIVRAILAANYLGAAYVACWLVIVVAMYAILFGWFRKRSPR